MDRNALHPERIARRLSTADVAHARNESCEDVPRLIEHLRDSARHYDDLAEIWEDPARRESMREANLHIVWHRRRVARHLREAAEAIERDHAAGPWVALDHPVVHLSEARPARQEEEVAH